MIATAEAQPLPTLVLESMAQEVVEGLDPSRSLSTTQEQRVRFNLEDLVDHFRDDPIVGALARQHAGRLRRGFVGVGGRPLVGYASLHRIDEIALDEAARVATATYLLSQPGVTTAAKEALSKMIATAGQVTDALLMDIRSSGAGADPAIQFVLQRPLEAEPPRAAE